MAQELIRVEQLSKEFYLDGDTIPVLKEIDLTVSVGERLAICGESGAGKSTLLQIMGALDQPTTGTLFFPAMMCSAGPVKNWLDGAMLRLVLSFSFTTCCRNLLLWKM